MVNGCFHCSSVVQRFANVATALHQWLSVFELGQFIFHFAVAPFSFTFTFFPVNLFTLECQIPFDDSCCLTLVARKDHVCSFVASL